MDVLPSKHISGCADRLRLLSAKPRLKIVSLLMEQPMTVSELLGHIPMEQNSLSHHLKVLRDGGLVAARREGAFLRYQLKPNVKVADTEIDIGCCRIVF